MTQEQTVTRLGNKLRLGDNYPGATNGHEERRQRLPFPFVLANAICDVECVTLSAASMAVQDRVIKGEISLGEAVNAELNKANARARADASR